MSDTPPSAPSETLCHCGKPLHYTDPRIQHWVERQIEALGPTVDVTVAGVTWLVDRHFIALHGIKAAELPRLGFARKGAGT